MPSDQTQPDLTPATVVRVQIQPRDPISGRQHDAQLQLCVPQVVMMCASKVSRSTMAAHSCGPVKVDVHSEKAALDAIAMEARSSRSGSLLIRRA